MEHGGNPTNWYQHVPKGRFSPDIRLLAKVWMKNLQAQGFTDRVVIYPAEPVSNVEDMTALEIDKELHILCERITQRAEAGLPVAPHLLVRKRP